MKRAVLPSDQFQPKSASGLATMLAWGGGLVEVWVVLQDKAWIEGPNVLNCGRNLDDVFGKAEMVAGTC